ncbi:MAG: hypothetical protein IKM79_01290 [Bacteroidales bacterium]|nr:hypothetical protein [Bacteroidales bacterium]
MLIDETMYAIYHASTTDNSNVITVTNSKASGTTITMSELAVNLLSNGKEELGIMSVVHVISKFKIQNS